MIELRKWIFGTDNRYIPSFLKGMSLAHDEPEKDEEWFHWKFEQSPYGKAVLACAFDGDIVAGCVAYGRGIVSYKNKKWSCALSYETYVHPDYQGKGLFKKLILLAEKEMEKEGIQFLYNFPNSNSITGFKHMGWICRNDIKDFKIKIIAYQRALLHLTDLKKSFMPNPSNIDDIKENRLDDIGCNLYSSPDHITPIWTKEYLKWRFFTIPNREYYVINNQELFSISMIGKRGSLTVIRHLYSVSKKGAPTKDIMKEVFKDIKSNSKADVFEYSSTIFDDSLKKCHGFIKLPTHGNFCYKVLDCSMNVVDLKIVLPSINAHTY